MKGYKIDISIFIGLLILATALILLTIGQPVIDIQLHDTYFVLDKISLVVLSIGPLMFLIFLIRALILKFKTKATNVGLIIALALVALITHQIIQLQQSFIDYVVSEAKKPDDGLTNTESLVVDARHKINLLWALFGFWIVGIFSLIVRTVKIPRMTNN